MADLVYTANISVDGYTEDPDGRLAWPAPDEEVFPFVTDLERPAGTYLYGRRLYETMLYWESAVPAEGSVRDFAEMWRDADKVVYSRRLASIASARTRQAVPAQRREPAPAPGGHAAVRQRRRLPPVPTGLRFMDLVDLDRLHTPRARASEGVEHVALAPS